MANPHPSPISATSLAGNGPYLCAGQGAVTLWVNGESAEVARYLHLLVGAGGALRRPPPHLWLPRITFENTLLVLAAVANHDEEGVGPVRLAMRTHRHKAVLGPA
jgi:hypothetical protein